MHEIVISNTTPVINLLKINKLHLLKELYGEIIIPYSVYQEIEEGKNKKYYIDLKSLDFIKIQKASDSNLLNLFIDLDNGEAETLLLALELNSDLVLIDEKLARRYAKNYNLNVSGTLGILIKAYKSELIDDLESCLDDLIENGTYLDKKLIENIKKYKDAE